MNMLRSLLLIALCALTPCSYADGKTYTLGVVPWAGCIPAVIADHEGFWKKQDVAVKVLVFDDMQTLEKMFYNRRLDILYHMLAAATAPYLSEVRVIGAQQNKIRSAETRIIAELDWSHGGDKVIVKNQLDAAMLKGKAVGIYLTQPSLLHLLGLYLESAGLTLTDVKLIEKDTATLSDRFIKDGFSAIVSYDPDALRAEQQGNGKVVATSADHAGIIPEGLMMLSDTFTATPPEDLSKILAGWIQALEWMLDSANAEEMTALANAHLFRAATPFSADEISAMMAGVRFHDQKTLRARNLEGGTAKYFQELHDFLQRHQLLEKSFTANVLFNNQAIAAALEQTK